MALTKDDLLYMTKISEQSERYDEMIYYIKELAKSKEILSSYDRNLLSIAYKNSVGNKRSSWRMLCTIEQKEENKGGKFIDLVRDYKKSIEDELNKLYTVLLSKAPDPESKIFYNKMKGDYYRYVSEYASGDLKQKVSQSASQAYQAAFDLAEDLPAINSMKLGLALNFSVFYYEVLNEPEKACELARKAFEEALAVIEDVPEEEYKDSTTILQLLRDNLALWGYELPEENQVEPQPELEPHPFELENFQEQFCT